MLENLQYYASLYPYVGLGIVFFGFAITNIFPIMFFIYPDVFIFLGLFLAAKIFPWWLVWIVLIFAAFIGEIISYFIGYKFADKILQHKLLQKEKLQNLIKNMKKNSIKYFITGKFIPGLVRVAPVIAGLIKMDFKKFLLYDFVMIVYGVSYFFIVWLVGFNLLKHFLGEYAWYLFGVIVVAYISWEYYKRKIKKDL